ncbi:MAG: outer membrane beta-barrel protein [Sandarakinorhabdus sp.]|jgi:outer membrane immunogenic protein|nr:outer membrane beta-barrel protein [Sandarakinorhabdus sp.]
MSLKLNPLFLASAMALAASPALAETAFDGPYVGAVAGLQLHGSKQAVTEGTAAFQTLTPNITPAALTLNDNDGFQGGVVAGYNVSSDNFLYGVELDVMFGNINGGAAFSGAAIPGLAPDGLTTSANRRIGTRGSLRARLGTTVGKDVLLYATGGLAAADTRGNANVVANGAPAVAWAGERNQTRWGWTVGAGAEFKLSSAIAMRAEYLYTDLGRQSVLAAGNSTVRSVAALDGIDYQVGLPYRNGTARVGFIVRF